MERYFQLVTEVREALRADETDRRGEPAAADFAGVRAQGLSA